MGCASSKGATEVAVADVYRPPPTSIALFDISDVEEPWLITTTTNKLQDQDQELEDDAKKPKSTLVPLPLLEKLDSYELAPTSWSEVSKALEDLKPSVDSKQNPNPNPPPKNSSPSQPPPSQTLQPQPQPQTPSVRALQDLDASGVKKPPPAELTGRRAVKENAFVLRDRENRNKDAAAAAAAIKWRRRDPFEGYPERRPPGAGGGGVVLYTTTLRGVRRTFEDCERVGQVVEAHAVDVGVPVDERDVSLHGEYLKEVKELAGGTAVVPRLFMMGRYIGGADEVVELAEAGKLREMMRWAAARGEAGKGGRGCDGCGGARFVPCWECGGSCKVVVAVADDGGGPAERVERCGKCNENGLMMCPSCH